MLRDRHAASLLARWLLPSKSPHKPTENMSSDRYPLFLCYSRGQKENTVPLLLASCVLRPLASNGFYMSQYVLFNVLLDMALCSVIDIY
jgi:hypothetical protein